MAADTDINLCETMQRKDKSGHGNSSKVKEEVDVANSDVQHSEVNGHLDSSLSYGDEELDPFHILDIKLETKEDFMCDACGKLFDCNSKLQHHIGRKKSCSRYYGKKKPKMRRTVKGRKADCEVGDPKERRREYYLNHREERLRKQREYYARNREEKIRKQHEYYQKNREEKIRKQAQYYQSRKEEIKDRQSLYYHLNKVELAAKRMEHYRETKMGEKYRRKNAIPEPEKPRGIVNVPLDVEEPEVSLLDLCISSAPANPGESKINHDDSRELLTLPERTTLRGKLAGIDEIESAESFVAMALSGDGESVEVRNIMRRGDINLPHLQLLFHCVLSVLDIDMHSLVTEKSSPIVISPPENLVLLRNRLTNELIMNHEQMPETEKPQCIPLKTNETHFITQEMGLIPYSQLLFNKELKPCDTGAVGVVCRNGGASTILPVFTVNMSNWKIYSRAFFTILVNWIGTQFLVNKVVHLLPCFQAAKEQYLNSVRMDCFENLQRPKEVSVCSQCGERFEYNKYLFKEKAKFQNHVESHRLNCKECGQEFATFTARRFHERTHKKDHVLCSKPGCQWVGRSQKSLETHVRITHTSHLCDLCGKEFPRQQNLLLHKQNFHLPELPRKFVCDVCGKGYKTKGILDKHLKRHGKSSSLVDKWMTDSPEEYKFICKNHNNCKKYFKTNKALQKHLRTYENKPYPEVCASHFIPHIERGDQNGKKHLNKAGEDPKPDALPIQQHSEKTLGPSTSGCSTFAPAVDEKIEEQNRKCPSITFEPQVSNFGQTSMFPMQQLIAAAQSALHNPCIEKDHIL